MLRDRLSELLTAAVEALIASERLPADVRDVPVEISDTKQPEHGDYACNFAMVAAKKAGMNPRELAEVLKEALISQDSRIEGSKDSENEPILQSSNPPILSVVEIAGPGFLNLRLKPEAIAAYVPEILALDTTLPNAQHPTPNTSNPPILRSSNSLHINVEFVSVNPNGPITIGSGRGAAYGSALCNVLEAAGNQVHREYYINDGTNSEQMRQFAVSVEAILNGQPVPDEGYKGDYVVDVAERIRPLQDELSSLHRIQEKSQALMLERQRSDLAAFGVEYDTWFSEQSLHDSGEVARCVEQLEQTGAADSDPFRTVLKLARGGVIEDVEKQPQTAEMETEDAEPPHEVAGSAGILPAALGSTPETGTADIPVGQTLEGPPNAQHPTPNAQQHPTLWLRSTKFGDDMDRVLRRRDGRLTYIASDVAYHKDKFSRGSKPNEEGRTEKADKLITILGPDHHGYIGRLTAVVAASLLDPTPNTQHSTPLDEIDAWIYKSPEERDAAHEATAKAREKLEVQIYQLVRFLKDGKPAPMRKRDGNIYALIDLVKEIGEKVKPNGDEKEKLTAGKDVARFFYLMRSHDTTFDFDLDLAEKQSDENPVFYVQYAHARIASVLRKAEDLRITGLEDSSTEKIQSSNPPILQSSNPSILKSFNPQILVHDRELSLIKKILDLPWEVERAAKDYGVHRLTTYAVELARTYHYFYDACRVIQPNQPELTHARLALCKAAQIGLKATLDLLGISAPERMERES